MYKASSSWKLNLSFKKYSMTNQTDKQKKEYENNIVQILKDSVQMSIEEMQKTALKIFATPKWVKGQITKDLEKFEKKLIRKRVHNQ